MRAKSTGLDGMSSGSRVSGSYTTHDRHIEERVSGEAASRRPFPKNRFPTHAYKGPGRGITVPHCANVQPIQCARTVTAPHVMTIAGPPSAYFFEDRTGALTGSDFDEVYDRAFMRVSTASQRTRNSTELMIYDMGQRSTSLGDRDGRHFYREPVIVLNFGPSGALGTVRIPKASVSIPMNQYLRKVSLFSGSLLRKFTASDGKEYKWGHHMVAEHEWTCLNADNFLVAHYNLKPVDRPAYGTSGNVLTVYESFAHLSTELLASLTIMRHIAQNQL